MADEVRVWQVTKDDVLAEMGTSALDREERIEKWITRDISLCLTQKTPACWS